MKRIDAGLGRTVTTSLKGALEALGVSSIGPTSDLFMSSKDRGDWYSLPAASPRRRAPLRRLRRTHLGR